LKASGVTSRPVSPVPPVESTTSTSGSAIQARKRPAMASAESSTISRATTLWPSASASS
jgi:hypothetical protein